MADKWGNFSEGNMDPPRAISSSEDESLDESKPGKMTTFSERLKTLIRMIRMYRQIVELRLELNERDLWRRNFISATWIPDIIRNLFAKLITQVEMVAASKWHQRLMQAANSFTKTELPHFIRRALAVNSKLITKLHDRKAYERSPYNAYRISAPFTLMYIPLGGAPSDDKQTTLHMNNQRKLLYHFPNLFRVTHAFSNRRALTSATAIITFIKSFHDKFQFTNDQILHAEQQHAVILYPSNSKMTSVAPATKKKTVIKPVVSKKPSGTSSVKASKKASKSESDPSTHPVPPKRNRPNRISSSEDALLHQRKDMFAGGSESDEVVLEHLLGRSGE